MSRELRRDFSHRLEAERTSLKESNRISPTTTIAPYAGSPGVVSIEIALDEIALDEIALDEIMLVNIKLKPLCQRKKYKVKITPV